jgi:ATP adenylyltransferase/5',5'''-P-1,P-4-tetraphosphate phosphorylase II
MNVNSINKLENLLEEKSSTQILGDFLNDQVKGWPLATGNYKGLEKVKEKEFEFDECKIKVQFNPERIRSSAAKVDQKSIENRACFLCLDKLPAEQGGIMHGDDFVILVNPFPIIPQHFTIPKVDHVDQSFEGNVSGMLSLAKNMEGYTLFYNGPKCGASAPDHMHFQAGNKDFMPVETEYAVLKNLQSELLTDSDKFEIRSFPNYLRKMISIESESEKEMLKAVSVFYQTFSAMQAEEKEPMLNVICSFVDGKYIMHLFPRKLHRPSQYFAEGDQQLLISPASVDFGGVFITPRREDFEKITSDDIIDIFKQVSVDDEFFKKLCTSVKENII